MIGINIEVSVRTQRKSVTGLVFFLSGCSSTDALLIVNKIRVARARERCASALKHVFFSH